MTFEEELYSVTVVPGSRTANDEPVRLILTRQADGYALFRDDPHEITMVQWFWTFQRELAFETAVDKGRKERNEARKE